MVLFACLLVLVLQRADMIYGREAGLSGEFVVDVDVDVDVDMRTWSSR